MQTLSSQQALELVKKYWNITGEIKSLPSYADQNFKISTTTHAYVFKIANPESTYADLDLENTALLHLEKTCPSLTLPKVIASVDGQYLIPMDNCYLRLLSYIEGDVYAHVAALKDKTISERTLLLQSLGAAVGKVAYGMRGFTHDNAQRYLDWNIIHLPLLHNEIALLEEADLRDIVQRHIDYFSKQLPTWLTTLPLFVNHNDANDFNVIVDPSNHQKVCAIIDFGDTCTSFRIADVAITCTYAMQFEDDIAEAMTAILQGYHQENPLQENEINALYAFTMARLCHSILMANKAFRHDPSNHYILVSQQAVRRLIRQLDVLDLHFII
jgi:Ser/Thr protein kinase RdoA (MazF antagonist)